jgi:F0F1-type ATP synthase epsilon subunit
MTLNLCVLTPNRIVWDSEVKEIILSTNSGQIGILPNHAPMIRMGEVIGSSEMGRVSYIPIKEENIKINECKHTEMLSR